MSAKDDRLRWIETWAKGWRNALTARHGDKDYYTELPLDVAVSMIEELVAELRYERKDVERAIQLLATAAHESGLEIGELVEAVRNSGR